MNKTETGLINPDGIAFYYLREKTKFTRHGKTQEGTQPIACVAITTDGKIMCRGVSICSENDNFSKAAARRISYARLLKAQGRKTTADAIDRNNTPSTLTFSESKLTEGINFKSGYRVVPTPFEKKILEKTK